jgi:hypothetical protein
MIMIIIIFIEAYEIHSTIFMWTTTPVEIVKYDHIMYNDMICWRCE